MACAFVSGSEEQPATTRRGSIDRWATARRPPSSPPDRPGRPSLSSDPSVRSGAMTPAGATTVHQACQPQLYVLHAHIYALAGVRRKDTTRNIIWPQVPVPWTAWLAFFLHADHACRLQRAHASRLSSPVPFVRSIKDTRVRTPLAPLLHAALFATNARSRSRIKLAS